MRTPALAAALLSLTAAVGCANADYNMLSVINDSDQTWLIRGPYGADSPSAYIVSRVAPHSSGPVLYPPKEISDPQFELLDESCNRLAVFVHGDGNTYLAPGIDAVRLQLGIYVPLQGYGQGITPIYDGTCGGILNP